jgi:IS30 family transposase
MMISKLKVKKPSLGEFARRIGKDESTVSRATQKRSRSRHRIASSFSRISRLWSEEQIDEYLLTQPPEWRQTNGLGRFFLS